MGILCRPDRDVESSNSQPVWDNPPTFRILSNGPVTYVKRIATSYYGRWDPVQLRCSNFMGCTLEERVALTLLEQSENFGVPDEQGMRLMVPATHKDFADLVGASHPRVTEFLTTFERKHMIVRDGRQLIVRRDRLESFLAEGH